ncbi:MAG: alkaline phosphatase [Bacteroidota bacterium]
MPRLVVACLLLLVAVPAGAQDAERPQNLILLIPDGFGPASATLARTFSGAPLALDGILRGAVTTAATDSRVTDSAASATAYAAGVRTYNGAIGVDTLRRPVGTILEAAEARGMATGLVVTSRVTHATPASFAAHVPNRWMEEVIAVQLMEAGVEVLFGGGRRFFVPEAEGGARTDGRSLLAEMRAGSVTVVTDPAAFDAASTVPVVGLFADDHLDYEIDRTDQPSLEAMTQRALGLLSADPDGFFLMVEGSRIDHAGHSNDPVGHVHDILAFDRAVRAALAFAEADGQTLVVVASDHETGGLSLGRDGVYAWHPARLRRATASADRLRRLIAEGGDPLGVLREHAAVDSLTADEQTLFAEGTPSALTIGRLVSRRMRLGWTTKGHTGIDVGLYAFGPGSEPLVGVWTNDALGRRLAGALGLDLEAATARLRAEYLERSASGD